MADFSFGSFTLPGTQAVTDASASTQQLTALASSSSGAANSGVINETLTADQIELRRLSQGLTSTATATNNNGSASKPANSGGGVSSSWDSYTTARGGTVDHRIRIRPFPNAASNIYGDTSDPSNLFNVLKQTNGVIFPYTPDIQNLQHTAQYEGITMVHSNQDFYVYKNTPSIQLTINGQFTASNYREAVYMFAAMHFFRTCTKMHFGVNDPNRGLPPPLLLLSGYGSMMFNDLPIILESVSFEYNKGVDYVPVIWNLNSGSANPIFPTGNPSNGSNSNSAAGTTTGSSNNSQGIIAWVPVIQSISVQVRVQNTPARVREFTWDGYRSGKLLTTGKGGFI